MSSCLQQSGSPVRSGLQRQNTFPLNPNHAASDGAAQLLAPIASEDSQPLHTA